MIRDAVKEYAEPKSPDTVLAPIELVKNKYVISAGGRNVKTFNPGPKRIMITNNNGDADSFSYNLPNKLIGINSVGQLELVSQAPIAPPVGRQLILDTSDPNVAYTTIQLEPFFWYEVEVIGAGGGGGGGVGRWHNDAEFLKGQRGGDGAYLKTTFKLSLLTEASFRPGGGGRGGNAPTWNYGALAPISTGDNKGGNGGRFTVKSGFVPVAIPNDGLNPVYMFNGTLTPLLRTGGAGVNGGANGGDSEVTLGNIGTGGTPSDTQGVGGSGGGANGPYGGAGGKSMYTNNVGVHSCASGGGGGGGGGVDYAGDGGGTNPSKPQGDVGAAGGSGVLVGSAGYTMSSGGGGGGGASMFQWGEHIIICGGGGGGAGAGYGGENHSTPGEPGTCNEEGYSAAGNGGLAGEGCNFYDLLTSKVCKGGNGGKGIIRLWRCV